MNIFESIANFLKGGNNAKRVGSHISRGHGLERRNLYSVQAVCEQAISDFCGIRVLAAACADERGRDTGSLPANPVCRESQALIAAVTAITISAPPLLCYSALIKIPTCLYLFYMVTLLCIKNLKMVAVGLQW